MDATTCQTSIVDWSSSGPTVSLRAATPSHVRIWPRGEAQHGARPIAWRGASADWVGWVPTPQLTLLSPARRWIPYPLTSQPADVSKNCVNAGASDWDCVGHSMSDTAGREPNQINDGRQIHAQRNVRRQLSAADHVIASYMHYPYQRLTFAGTLSILRAFAQQPNYEMSAEPSRLISAVPAWSRVVNWWTWHAAGCTHRCAVSHDKKV